MSSLYSSDKLIFVSKDSLYPDFFQRLIDDTDSKMELATNHHESVVAMIKNNVFNKFPVKWRWK